MVTTADLPILSAPDMLTPERVTRVLRESGAITDASVVHVDFEPIGAGLLGDTMRFNLRYDRDEPGAPMTLAGKFPAVDPHARAGGKEIGVYLTETRFYQTIAADVPVRAPRCHYAVIDPESCEFGVLLEDVGPARAADQLTGCTRADAEEALRQAAALHAPRFGDADIWSIDWMKIRYGVLGKVCDSFDDYVRTFLERYADMLEPEYQRLTERFAPLVREFALKRPDRYALIHGDFRLDNMLFDAKGGDVPLVILDWQSIAPENPGIDFSYFIGTSYPMDLRARDELDLVRYYHEQMQARGVRTYAWDDVWRDYRRGAWLGLFTAVFASAVTKRTDRGDRMFMRMARGSAAQMVEHDTLSLA
ncbi:MAG: phosphotransferase [Sphingobium sp.]